MKSVSTLVTPPPYGQIYWHLLISGIAGKTLPSMKSDKTALFEGRVLAINGALTFLLFVALAWLLRPFVPTESEVAILAVASFTSFCIAGVFFLVLHMLTAVYRDYRARRREF